MAIETIGVGFDPSGLRLGQKELEKTAQAANKAADAVDKTSGAFQDASGRWRDASGRFVKANQDIERSANSTAISLKAMGAALAASGMAAAAVQIIKLADAYAQLNARLALVTSGTSDLAKAQEALFKISQATRTDLAGTMDLYASLARATKGLGVSQQQLLTITDTFNKALTISGGSAQAAEAALTQFNQAMASGVLRGEEFNSISEQAPRIMDLLATSLGKSRGELRAMAEQGMLTADVVLPAIIRGAKDVSAEFERMPVTVSQSVTVIKNSLLQLVGQMDSTLGGANSLAGVILGLSDVLDAVTKHFRDTTTAASDTQGSFSIVVEVFKVLTVLGAEAAYMIKAVGTEIGGMAAQIAALSRLDWQAFGAIREAMVQDAETARANIDKLTKSIMESGSTARKAGDDYSKVSAQITGAGVSADKFTSRAEKQRQELDALKTSFDAATLGITDHAKLQQMATAYREQAAAIEKKYSEAVKVTTKTLGDAGKAEAKLAEQRASAMTEDERFSRHRAKVFEERARQEESAQRNAIDAARRQAQSVKDKADALEREVKQWGMSEQAIYAVIAAQKDERAESERRAGTSADIVAAIESEAESYRRLADAADDMQALRVGEDQARKAADEWRRTTDQIRDGLTNALMRAFESGKGFGRALRDSLVNMFKTMVLEPTLRAVIQGGLGAVGMNAVANGAGQAAAGSAGGAALGNVPGTLLTSLAGSGLTSIGGALLGAGATGAGTFAAYTGAGLSSFGSMAGMGANLALGAQAVGAGSLAAGAGLILGTALPVLAVLAGLAAAFGAFDRGAPKTGGQSFFNTETGNEFDRGYRLYTPNQSDATLQKITQSIGQGYRDTAKGLGFKTIQDFVFGLGFDMAPDGKAEPRLTSQLIGQNQPGAPKLYENLNQQISGDIKDALGLESQRLIMAAIKGGLSQSGLQEDLIKAMEEVFGGVDLATATQEQITAMQQSLMALKQVRDSFESLGKVFPQLSGLAFGAEKALADAFGGLPNMMQKLSSYQQNYYTEAERANMATASLQAQFEKLGVTTVPATRDAFRQLVEAQDLSTESGRNTYAGLLMISEAFAQLNPEITKMGAVTAESIGLGADAIKAQVLTALTSGDDATLAGQAFGDSLVKGVYDAMAQSASQQITTIITQGLVDPIVKAVSTGALITDAISSASIAEMVKKAKAVASAFATLMQSDDFKAAMEQIRSTGQMIGSSTAGLFSPANIPVTPYKPPATQTGTDIGDAQRLAAEDERRQAEILARSRQQDIELLKAQGKSQELVNLEREREIEALNKLDSSGGLAGRQRDIYAAIDQSNKAAEAERQQKAIDDARKQAETNQNALFSRYGDPVQLAYKQLAESAKKYGVEGLLPLDELLKTDPMKLRAIVDGMVRSADPATESGRQVIAILSALSPAFDVIIAKAGEAKNELLQAANAAATYAAQVAEANLRTAQANAEMAQANVEAALQSVQAAVQAERDALTTSYERESDALRAQIEASAKAADRFRSLSSLLRNAGQMEASGTETARRGEAQAQLRAMLMMARGTGLLPSQDALKSALDGVAKPSTGLFRSFEEYLLDFDKTKSDINELADLTDAQLSVEEQAQKTLNQQLETLRAGFDAQNVRLDGILQAAQLQVAGLYGVQQGVMSVAQAMAGLSSAIDASRAANSALAGAQAAARDASLTTLATQAIGADMTPGRLESIIQAGLLAGFTPEQMADRFNQITGGSDASAAGIRALAAKAGIPGFAMGGVVDGPTMALIGEGRYSEAVVPLPDGRSIPVKMSGEIAELVAEIKGLREDVRAGDAGNVAVTNRLDRLLNRWDRDGLPETRVA